MRFPSSILALALALLPVGVLADTPAAKAPDPFVIKPYVQLGDAPALTASESLQILWQTADTDADWKLQVKRAGDSDWTSADAPAMRKVAVPTIEPHRLYRAAVTHLAPGSAFTYRLLRNGAPVFEANAQARKPAAAPTRFVVFGDCADDTPGQRGVAYQTYLLKPDYVFITGDIVYKNGRVSEYRQKYFPIYNADTASATTGAPLIRSTLFLAAPGNHDLLKTDLTKMPDAFAYFYNWAQPLNGPLTTINARSAPNLNGPDATQKAFLAGAGNSFPRMANFSFDYGNAHWTVLDSNPYVDWSDPALRKWVTDDIAAAKNATWHFVGFHHPGFNSADKHANDQWMRQLSDLFEQSHVDIVFSGHVHNYQRTYPLKFALKKQADGSNKSADGEVDGDFTLDKEFDGDKVATPKGVLYIITGAGGAHLYDPEIQGKQETWKPFTSKYIADTNSLTAVEINGKTLTIRQISATGKEVDRFTVKK